MQLKSCEMGSKMREVAIQLVMPDNKRGGERRGGTWSSFVFFRRRPGTEESRKRIPGYSIPVILRPAYAEISIAG